MPAVQHHCVQFAGDAHQPLMENGLMDERSFTVKRYLEMKCKFVKTSNKNTVFFLLFILLLYLAFGLHYVFATMLHKLIFPFFRKFGKKYLHFCHSQWPTFDLEFSILCNPVRSIVDERTEPIGYIMFWARKIDKLAHINACGLI